MFPVSAACNKFHQKVNDLLQISSQDTDAHWKQISTKQNKFPGIFFSRNLTVGFGSFSSFALIHNLMKRCLSILFSKSCLLPSCLNENSMQMSYLIVSMKIQFYRKY